jgi:WD40 repeat protein/serine/threonine protein kinase
MAVQKLNEEAIFNVARKIESLDGRRAYLEQVCGEDAALHARVQALLRVHEEDGSFLKRPLPALVGTALEPLTERPGTVIGPYKLLEQIGEGGFGIVFMAEQQRPVRRKVALKIVKPGMDTRQVVARFEAERQALALMDHANIARVFDGGETASGRPFFVMELVRGIPITDFCDQNHLPIRERLELYMTVCQAVQHAHQRGIIHRDLKPSNVLVTLHDGRPVVKVIDFGIAKATGQQLTEKTLFTNFAQLIGTPLYMSPEQAEPSGLDIDTRSDIYSLGVLLYELLTGTTPFDKERLRTAAYDEIRRIIREEEPAKPSTRISRLGQAATTVSANRKSDPRRLAQLCRGELDWIVMKALEKDRNRRYESASAFAADVQRYLQDEPVHACPPSSWYRLRKFARRHKRMAVLTAAAIFLLLAATGVSSYFAIQADQRARDAQAAEQNETEQRAIAVEQADRATREAARSRRLLYASEMNLAGHAWEVGDTGRARALLERQWPQEGQDDLRGFEWRYLWRLCQDGSRQTLRGHTGTIWAIAFAPDGRTLASSSLDHSVCIWDLASQRRIGLLGLRAWGSASLAFAPDGKTLAIARVGRPVRLWDLAARCERASFWHRSNVNDVAFSPDGKLLATACHDRTVRIWEVATGREVGTLAGHPLELFCVKFSPDGKTLASSGRDTAVRLWDVAARSLIATLEGHTHSVPRLSFSPDCRTLASSSWDGTVRLWDTASRQEVKILRGQSSVAFSPDGKVLATGGGDGTLRLWDRATNQVTGLLRGHTSPTGVVAFAPDGRSLVSGSHDGTIKVWDVGPRPDPNTLTDEAGLDSLAISPDGNILAVGDFFDKTVKLYDIASRQRVAVLRGHEMRVWCVTFAPGGQNLASTGSDGTVLLWNLATKGPVAKFQHDSGVLEASFSPDGKLLAAGGTTGLVRVVLVWEIATRQQVARLAGTRVQFSPDGTLLATNSGNALHLWDVTTWREVAAFEAGAYDGFELGALAFAPDGKILATGAADGTLRLWDVAQKRQVASSRAHASRLHSAAFSPDGRRLATGGLDGTVKLWDVGLLQEVANFTGHHGPVGSLAFLPDGNTLATASYDATVRLWQAPPLPAALHEPADAPSVPPPVETFRLFSLELVEAAQGTLTPEGKAHRVDVTAVDGTPGHAQLSQVFDDLQEGATYTVRFRAKADTPRRMKLWGESAGPDRHGIGLDEEVSLSEDWQTYQCQFQAKNLKDWTKINFRLGNQTGTVWIADFTVNKGGK